MQGLPTRLRRVARISALAAVTMAGSLAAASAANAAPTLTVTPTVNLDPAAPVTLTVTGSGYSGAAGGGTGIYLAFGPKSASGAAFVASQAQLGASKWTHLGATPSAGQATLNADGTFSTTLTVNASYGSVNCRVVQCGVITVAAHGDFSDRTQDAFTPTLFSTTGMSPSVNVTPTTGLDRDAETTVTVSGTGFDPNAANGKGFYVAFGPKGSDFSTNTAPYYKAVYVRLTGTTPDTTLNLDGSWSTTIAVKRAYSKTAGGATTDYDCSQIVCNVLTFGAQGSTDRSLDTTTQVTFAPAPGAPGPAISVSPTTGLSVDGPTTVNVSGSGFDPVARSAQGIYVAYGPLGATAQNDYFTSKWVAQSNLPTATRDTLSSTGTFSTTLSVSPSYTGAVSAINCTVLPCYVQTFAAHGDPDRTQDTAQLITFGGTAANAAAATDAPAPDLVPEVAPTTAPSTTGTPNAAGPLVGPKVTKVVVGKQGKASLKVSEPSTVTFTVRKKVGKKYVVVKTITVTAKTAGTVNANLKITKKGLYRITMQAKGPNGGTKTVVKSLRVG
jgi:hypothetical protein